MIIPNNQQPYMPYECFQQQQRYEEMQMRQALEIQTAAEKARIADAAEERRYQRREIYDMRRELRKEARAEQKRKNYQKVEIDAAGNLSVFTENLSIDAQRRRVSNLQVFALDTFIRLSQPSNIVFRLRGKVSEKDANIYFEKRNTGRTAYLVRRLRENGVEFYPAESEINGIIQQLWAQLLQRACEKTYIPDKPGWVKIKEKWIFWKEDWLNWKDLELEL